MLRAAALAALLVVALPVAALAKGPDAAQISGPGMDKPAKLQMSGEEGGGTVLSTIVEETGLFAAMFGQTPNPMLAERPAGELGPAYTIVYRVPDGTSKPPEIRQELYPFATGGPVSHTAAGQRVYDQSTVGGWYRGSAARLLPILDDLGVPKAAGAPRAAPKQPSTAAPAARAPAVPAPASARSAGIATPVWLALAVTAGCLAVMAAVVVRGGRRQRRAAVGG
jgi:hypothetical protein